MKPAKSTDDVKGVDTDLGICESRKISSGSQVSSRCMEA